MEVVYEGTVAIDGSTKIICNTSTLTIHSITINNITSAYTFTLNRLLTSSSTFPSLVYDFDLDLGDSIRDTTQYDLIIGNCLQLISSVAGTTYYINATQE